MCKNIQHEVGTILLRIPKGNEKHFPARKDMSDGGLKMSGENIQKNIYRGGIFSYWATGELLVTTSHIHAQLAFAKKHIDWGRVIVFFRMRRLGNCDSVGCSGLETSEGVICGAVHLPRKRGSGAQSTMKGKIWWEDAPMAWTRGISKKIWHPQWRASAQSLFGYALNIHSLSLHFPG